ncbi:hypothetical protein [Nocardiopsis synnemataformans]|uniref:hypothetical protein n=1 Tax=Nocardiopsis synnemataformans TaxID=61305 RepID=UPI003EB7AC34
MVKFKINHGLQGVPEGNIREVEADYYEESGEFVRFIKRLDNSDRVPVLALKVGMVHAIERVQE